MDVHVAARVMATGHGGQVIVSGDTRASIEGGIDGLEFVELGVYRLKGVPDVVRLFQVSQAGTTADFPPIRAEMAVLP
jgi:class 3 adenylate cyclase